MAGVRVLASPHPNQPTGRVRTKKKKEPARTTPKPTGWPGCAPKTGNQRAPSSGATPFFQHPPFLDKYAGNKKITIERVAVTRRAVSPSNAKDLVFGLCLCLLAPSLAPYPGRRRAELRPGPEPDVGARTVRVVGAASHAARPLCSPAHFVAPQAPARHQTRRRKRERRVVFPRHVLTKKSGWSWTNRAVLNVWTRTTSFV